MKLVVEAEGYKSRIFSLCLFSFLTSHFLFPFVFFSGLFPFGFAGGSGFGFGFGWLAGLYILGLEGLLRWFISFNKRFPFSYLSVPLCGIAGRVGSGLGLVHA